MNKKNNKLIKSIPNLTITTDINATFTLIFQFSLLNSKIWIRWHEFYWWIVQDLGIQFQHMINLFKQLDFAHQIEENKELKAFIIEACKKIEQEQSEALRKIKKPELDDELINQFIINGIPVLKPDNQQKFLTLFKTKLLQAKKIGEKNGLLSIEIGREKGIGNQTLYLTYKTNSEAKVAFNKLNNFKFDKNHTLQCYSINDIRTFLEEEQKNIQNKPFQIPVFAKSSQKLEHNIDEQFRSQFLIRQANMIYLNWLDHLDKSAKSVLSSQYMNVQYTINKMVFSPLGAYLAVCCQEGTHIYYGNNLAYKGLLPQSNAVDAKFSFDQKIIITSNGNLSKNRENFIIWGLEEQLKIKAYKAHSNQSLQSFQFSQNSKSLAIILQHQVAVYSTESIEQLKKQLKLAQEQQNIVKALHVQKIAWLKGSVWFMVMCFQLDYNPVNKSATRLFLYNVQTKQERRWRAWSQHAKNGQIFVSERGDWVAISLKKFLKKNHFATVIQIANLLRKQQPLQIVSLQIREQVDHIYWDWHNNRFGVVSQDESTKKGINVRFIVSFYEIIQKNKSLQIGKIGEIKDNLQNRVLLSSNGGFFALYNITDQSPERGKFSLGLITKQTKQKGKRVINFQFTKQNLIVNGMSFFHVDQSGRFILLGTEKGYQIWNFIGEIVVKDTLQKNIFDVQWRPRFLTQLPEEQEKALLDNEKEIRKKYEQMDDKRINFLKYQKQAAKNQQKLAFLEYISNKQKWFKQFNDLRYKALGFKQFQVRTDKYEVSQGFIDIK